MSETKKGRKAVAGKRTPARAAVVSTPKKRAPRVKQEVVEEIFEVEVPAPTTRKTRQPAAARKVTKAEKVAKPATARKTSKVVATPVEEPAKPARRAKSKAVVVEAPAKPTRAAAKPAKTATRTTRAKAVVAEPEVVQAVPARGRKSTRKAAVEVVAAVKPATKVPRKRAAKVEEVESTKHLSAVEKLRIVQERRRRKRYERLAAEAVADAEKAAPARKRKAAAPRRPRTPKA